MNTRERLVKEREVIIEKIQKLRKERRRKTVHISQIDFHERKRNLNKKDKLGVK